MKRDIRVWTRVCYRCLLAKARQATRHKGYSTFEVERPHQAFGIDFWDPTVQGIQGYKYMLVVVDLFHAYLRLLPVASKTAEEAAAVLYRDVFTHTGLPRMILSDTDPAFCGKVMKELTDITGMTWPKAAPGKSGT